jgi:flagellar hook assembly protein FlgD
LLSLLVVGGWLVPAGTQTAVAQSVSGLKAVVIVGPAASSTWKYLSDGERIARQAEAQGMDVRRVFTPNATWSRVKANIQGANLVVYLGHGNGWPSHLGPFRGESKDGFGLNPCDGDCGTSGPTKYYGEQFIREKLTFAPNAVVFLHRLCYASGNGEGFHPPVFNRDLATERASNFASGFLDAGAGVVLALGWRQKLDLPALLATTDKTMDEIFMTRGSDGDWYDGFQGWDDYYRDSTRTKGARVHLDPHRRHGHLRAITGDLDITASEWRGEPAPLDETPPTLKVKGLGTADDRTAAGVDETLIFSPNGDGIADRMLVRRSLSEPAYVDAVVRDANGDRVRTAERFGQRGNGETFWDGRNDAGETVPDGRYTIHLTPRDRAGNVGETATVEVKVLTMLRRLRATDPALHARDGDDLAATVGLTAKLRTSASVTLVIRKGDRVIRTRYSDEPLEAGAVSWRWDGRNDAGEHVGNGTYTAAISAKTELGTLRYETKVRVGNWRITTDDRAVRRGQEVQVRASSLEPLASAQLEITQPGLEPRLVPMKLRDEHLVTVTFKVAKGGDVGRIGLRVIANDIGGQEEAGGISIRLR